jgi:hypothetical protein
MRTTFINAMTAGVLACTPPAFAAEPWHQQVATGSGSKGRRCRAALASGACTDAAGLAGGHSGHTTRFPEADVR